MTETPTSETSIKWTKQVQYKLRDEKVIETMQQSVEQILYLLFPIH